MNASNETTYDVVFSYQGAFETPTFGHFASMEMFAEKILIDYPTSNIRMLFMPTALSSSKPHLEPTQQNRIAVLNKFCKILKEKYKDNDKITFEASEIEYQLCASHEDGSKIDTGTYRTIDMLKEIYPTSIIILGMGKDNILQLPYWKNIDEYADKVTSIYVVDRQLSKAEEKMVADFKITVQDGVSLPFQKILPWQKPKEEINSILGITGLDTKGNYEKGIDVTKIIEGYEPHININLPNILVLTGLPPPTSSSMLRYYIYKYIIESNEKVENEIKEIIKNIMFGQYSDVEITWLVDQTINGYKNENENNEYKFSVPIDDGYDAKYTEIFNNNGFTFGGKSSKNNRKKSNKRNNRTRKNRTRKNQKSKNKNPLK